VVLSTIILAPVLTVRSSYAVPELYDFERIVSVPVVGCAG
jgi:hypothetical protein